LDTTTGNINRISDTANDPRKVAVSLIKMAPSGQGNGDFLVGACNAAGKLVLQRRRLNDKDHFLYFVASSDEQISGEISHLAVGFTNERIFTAVRTSGGNLKVIIWETHDGLFRRVGDSGQQGPPVRLVEALSFINDQIITTVRDSGGNLKLITWQVSADGKTVNMLGDSGNAADAVDLLASEYFPYDDHELFVGPSGTGIGRVFTAVRTGAKNLKIIGWQVNVGGAITSLPDSIVRKGTVDAVAFKRLGGNSSLYVSAVRDAANHQLRLDVWQITSS
jgi:hypothetical protein